MKKIRGIYFSGTGSTKKVLKYFLDSWKQEYQLISIPFDLCDTFDHDDVCVAAIPCYGGRVPSVASAYLNKLKGSNTAVILIVTYGNRAYDDTFVELEDILKERGFIVRGAMAVICQHSIIHQFASNRPNNDDLKQISNDALKFKEYLTDNNKIKLPGNRPYRQYNSVPLKPSASKACNKCGICVAQCPVGAILKENPAKVDKEICISCMRCMAVCPQHARKLNGLLLKIGAIPMKKECQKNKENEIFL